MIEMYPRMHSVCIQLAIDLDVLRCSTVKMFFGLYALLICFWFIQMFRALRRSPYYLFRTGVSPSCLPSPADTLTLAVGGVLLSA